MDFEINATREVFPVVQSALELGFIYALVALAIFFIYLLIIYPACPARDEKSDDPPARVIAFSFIYKVRSPDGFPFRPPWAALSTTGAACATAAPQ